MKKIINTVAKFLAVLFALGILMSVSSLAQSFNAANAAILFLNIYALNKCCGILIKMVNSSDSKEVEHLV